MTPIDISAHIQKLLYQHDSLNIPGFGGFTATRTNANADYIGGTVTPPAKSLNFSENLAIDDGILAQDIAQTNHISTEEARTLLDNFVNQMQQQLNQREIVSLPGVGRLYKNYMQKIQFLPDITNFNAESFGLPPLQFSPIARSREVAERNPVETVTAPAPAPVEAPVHTPVEAAVPEAPVTTPAEPLLAPEPTPVAVSTAEPVSTATYTPEPYLQEPARSGSSGLIAAAGIALLLMLVAGGIWYWQKDKTNPVAGTETDKTTTEKSATPRINEKPAPVEKPAASSKTPAPAKEPVTSEPAKPKVTPPTPKEAPATAPATGGGKHCILVVATLQEKSNSDRLIKMLKNAGYEVYLSQKKGFQVGIQFDYSDLSEVQQKIVALQKLTGEPNIWIKQK